MFVAVTDLRERLRAVPGVEPLLPALEGLPPAYLVGGAARDLLRGERALDLDVAVEGDGVLAAQEIARRLGGTTTRHERFGTATVATERLRVDVASTRTETYDQPGRAAARALGAPDRGPGPARLQR